MFKKGKIDGVKIEKLVKYVDERGWLCEIFRHDELDEEHYPVMSYISVTQPEVARGPHFHNEQTDCFIFLGPGNFKIYLWDARKDSQTYNNKMVFYGGKDNLLQVIIPPGVVHAYKNVSKVEEGMVVNVPNKLFMGENKKEEVDEIRDEDDPESPYVLD